MGKLFDTVALSIVYVLVCIPIVTIGPATSALYYSTVKSIRRDRSYPIKEFFKAFKRDFKQSFIVGLILVVVGLILYVDVKFAINYIKNSLTYMRYLYIVIGIGNYNSIFFTKNFTVHNRLLPPILYNK